MFVHHKLSFLTRSGEVLYQMQMACMLSMLCLNPGLLSQLLPRLLHHHHPLRQSLGLLLILHHLVFQPHPHHPLGIISLLLRLTHTTGRPSCPVQTGHRLTFCSVAGVMYITCTLSFRMPVNLFLLLSQVLNYVCTIEVQ